jgi:hypothetical protein
MIQFIIIDSVCGQYTIEFETPDINFLVIKQFILQQTWDEIKNDNEAYMPILSTSANELDFSKHIDEDKPLSVYNLQNGGVIFLHYLKFKDLLN